MSLTRTGPRSSSSFSLAGGDKGSQSNQSTSTGADSSRFTKEMNEDRIFPESMCASMMRLCSSRDPTCTGKSRHCRNTVIELLMSESNLLSFDVIVEVSLI